MNTNKLKKESGSDSKSPENTTIKSGGLSGKSADANDTSQPAAIS